MDFSHDHIHYSAALVHHGVEFCLHTVGAVLHCHPADQAGGRGQNHVAPGGGGDVGSRRPQQSDVPHDDLPADGKAAGHICLNFFP